MSWFLEIHLIRLFNFYLTFFFIVTTILNIRDYRHMVELAQSLPGRWPRLFELLKHHSHIFLTWRLATPFLTSLGLLVVQLLVTRVIAPAADHQLTVHYLLPIWPVLPFLIATATVMIVIDVYASWPTTPFERPAIEKHFDQAEFWLKAWTAPVVRVMSLGYINPRQLVTAEVRTALLDASNLLTRTLWWTAWQATARIVFGLSLWLTYALAGSLHHLMYGD
jgi:hypothetical protein